MAYGRATRTFVSTHAQIFHEFRKNSSTYPWEFEEKNKILNSSMIIINYCIIIIIINAYCNYVVQLMHNIIIICIISASSRNAMRKKMWK